MNVRSPILTLLVLALLAQASVPLLHAQNWAQMHGNNRLAYAFCGKLSPALAAKMRKVVPPELIRELSATQEDAKDCKLCFVVNALGALLGVMGIALWLLTRQQIVAVCRLRTHTAVCRAMAFQPRAPPHMSFA